MTSWDDASRASSAGNANSGVPAKTMRNAVTNAR
jgi:hypothetical protein